MLSDLSQNVSENYICIHVIFTHVHMYPCDVFTYTRKSVCTHKRGHTLIIIAKYYLLLHFYYFAFLSQSPSVSL